MVGEAVMMSRCYCDGQEELKLQELENKKQEEVNRELRAAIEEARRRSRVLEKQLREGNNKGNS